MAEVSLVFKTTKASIGSLELDASVTETHSAEVDVTDHPIESGANISDHVRPKVETLTIEGLVTNSPLPVKSDPLVSYTYGSQTVSSRSRFFETRAGQAYADLRAMKDAGQLLTIVTALRSYENMVIQTLNVPRDATSGQALRFSVTLKQIRKVTNRAVSVVNVENKGKKKKDLGPKSATPTPAATDNKSMLREAILAIQNMGR